MQKPHATVIVLGPGPGKACLAAGLRRAVRSGTGGEAACELVITGWREVARAVTLATTEVESTRRRYTLVDPGASQVAATRVATGRFVGESGADGAVLLVDTGQRYGPGFKDDLRLLVRMGVAGLVVVMDRADGEDPEFVDLAEQELRAALCEAGCEGDAVPVVHASLTALRDGEAAGVEAAFAVFEALDAIVAKEVVAWPRVVMAGVIAGEHGEVAASGRVIRGGLEAGERIEVVGVTPTRMAQLVTIAEADGGAHCRLGGVTSAELRVGQTLALPGTLAPQQRFEAEVWFDRPRDRQVEHWQIAWFDVITVGGVAKPARDGASGWEVELATALVLVPGDGFGVIAGGVMIGVGVVVAVRGLTRKRRRGALTPDGLGLALVDSINRGDRPDVVASLLLPPDDVLQATCAEFAADIRSHVRSGRMLLELIGDGRRERADYRGCVAFNYVELRRRPGCVEYGGPAVMTETAHPERQLARGTSITVYVYPEGEPSGHRDYRLSSGLTVRWIRCTIRVPGEGETRTMLVGLWVAEFEVMRGFWYLFDFDCPSSWDRF